MAVSGLLPSNLLRKFARTLFDSESSQNEFIASLQEPRKFPQALIWHKDRPAELPFSCLEHLSWQPAFVDRVEHRESPGRHPLHDQGYFYVLDFSSVFACAPLLEILLLEIQEREPTVIDVCSAPGGKAVFASAALKPRTIICNEVIRKRTAPLIANLRRLNISNAQVMSHDPEDLAREYRAQATVVLVDAPCSGQSLLAKGKKADGCFHPLVISRNAKRQRRILANSVSLLADGGYLLYSTCTFSLAENENNISWLLEQFTDLSPVCINALTEFQSPYVMFPAYRLWPASGLGAGSFAVLLKKTQKQ